MHGPNGNNHRIAAVLSGRAEPIAVKSGRSGIFKDPLDGPAFIGIEGVEGDAIVDRENHGGPDQAVLVQGGADSAFWEAELSQEVPPGTFGENLFLDGMASADVAIGDILECGPVRMQVTAPRIPCVTLGARMSDPTFPKRFFKAGRPGFYCRILTPGHVDAGMDARLVPFDGTRVSVATVLAISGGDTPDEAILAALAAAPGHAKMLPYLKDRFADSAVFSSR